MTILQQARMDKTAFTVVALTDESDEYAYWQTQTPQARLQALELMRQVMYGIDYTSARLQRVLAVASLASS